MSEFKPDWQNRLSGNPSTFVPKPSVQQKNAVREKMTAKRRSILTIRSGAWVITGVGLLLALIILLPLDNWLPAQQSMVSSAPISTPQITSSPLIPSPTLSPSSPSPKANSFKRGVFISEEDRAKVDPLPALEAALGFLQAWVDKDEQGFLKWYPSVDKAYEEWQSYFLDPAYEYSFTEIISTALPYPKQYVINVAGIRRDKTTGGIEPEYAAVCLEPQPNGEWRIYMLD